MNYYNEYDPNAAAWLRELISYGAIPNGHVDTRSIRDVQPSDLSGYTQCHFFAGIGGWSYALRLAGWPETRPVWTGSCPCQPFSSAGKQRGTSDERHLWPEFFRLIRECRPATIFGEQVASPVALDWLDAVSADLEGAGYAVGAADLCAAGIGAPHIRQRLYWVGNTIQPGLEGQRGGPATKSRRDGAVRPVAEAGESGGVADTDERQRGRVADGEGCECDGPQAGRIKGDRIAEPGSELGRLANAGHGSRQRGEPRAVEWGLSPQIGRDVSKPTTDATNGFWGNPDWLLCRDGKWRPVESGTFPLAHRVPGRVGLLRGYGNAICSQLAAEFIEAAVQD